jgi:hypothetical protein
MFYTPAGSVPGKSAHIKLDWAIASAKLEKTVVYDDDFNIIYDFRKV